MSYEVDQSGKVERTSVNTVVAFSNSKTGYIYLKAKDKKYCNYTSPR